MTLLLFGLALFFAVHGFTLFRTQRAAVIARIGALPYRGLYSVLALAGFVALVIGYGQAPRIELWAPPAPLRPVALVLMLPVFVLLVAAYLPCHIRARLGHPMLIAVKTWALAHLLVNGDLASLLLFGSFLAWAVIDLVQVRRGGRTTPVAAPRDAWDAVAVGVGLVVYGLFLTHLHAALIGVPLLAP